MVEKKWEYSERPPQSSLLMPREYLMSNTCDVSTAHARTPSHTHNT
jgi:hypothetical protein